MDVNTGQQMIKNCTVPCPGYGFLLEVRPEAPIAKHFKESVVIYIFSDLDQMMTELKERWKMDLHPPSRYAFLLRGCIFEN